MHDLSALRHWKCPVRPGCYACFAGGHAKIAGLSGYQRAGISERPLLVESTGKARGEKKPGSQVTGEQVTRKPVKSEGASRFVVQG